MSKHYNYEYKKKPRIKKEFVFGDLSIPLNVGYETSIDLLDTIEKANENELETLKTLRDTLKFIFADKYEAFVKEFEKDGDCIELEDFQDIAMIVIASLNNVEPDKVDEFFRNNK